MVTRLREVNNTKPQQHTMNKEITTMKLPYQLSHEDKTIALTRKFAKESSVPGSDEYILFMKLKTDFPTYDITMRNLNMKKKKQKYTGLTYEKMFDHIRKVHGEDALNDLLFQMDLNHNEAGAYGRVKSWFLAEHADYKS